MSIKYRIFTYKVNNKVEEPLHPYVDYGQAFGTLNR